MRLTKCVFMMMALSASQANAQAISATLDASDPVIATITVIATGYAMERFEGYCQRVHPNTAASIKSAREAWLERQDALFRKAGEMMTALLSQEERNRLFAGFVQENDRLEAILDEAPIQESREWCGTGSNRFTEQGLDLMSDSQLVATIKNYQL